MRVDQLRVANVAGSPVVRSLGKGFLTGTITAATNFEAGNDIRTTIPRFEPEAREHNQGIVDVLTTVARRHQATPGHVALAWLLAQRPWIVPIPGTRKPRRFEENTAAADLDLSDADLRELHDAVSAITVQGGRYSDAAERMTNL